MSENTFPQPILPGSTVDNSRPNREVRKDDLQIKERQAREPISFRPFEADCDLIRERHDEFQLWPRHSFQEWTSHVPYNGKKLSEVTGRSGFEVFGYEIAGREEIEHKQKHAQSLGSAKSTVFKRLPIMWDYQIGLVRMTPIYKACGFNTLAAKVWLPIYHMLSRTDFLDSTPEDFVTKPRTARMYTVNYWRGNSGSRYDIY